MLDRRRRGRRNIGKKEGGRRRVQADGRTYMDTHDMKRLSLSSRSLVPFSFRFSCHSQDFPSYDIGRMTKRERKGKRYKNFPGITFDHDFSRRKKNIGRGLRSRDHKEVPVSLRIKSIVFYIPAM